MPVRRHHPAPALREVAEVWWDLERDPVVAWDATGRRFWLTDPEEVDRHLALATYRAPVADPPRVARALAEGLASCDFPPTEDAASPSRVAATLRAASLPAPES